MKKITLFAIIVAATSLTACKKDRTCSCTQTTTDPSGTTSYSYTKTVQKSTKGTAKVQCISYKYTDTNNGISSTTETSCSLN